MQAAWPTSVQCTSQVNSIHLQLKYFMDRIRKVLAKYLQYYPEWFCYKEQFRRSNGYKREQIYRHE